MRLRCRRLSLQRLPLHTEVFLCRSSRGIVIVTHLNVGHLALQVRNNASLCAAPLLAHPLTQRRLRRLYHVMDMLLLVLPTGALLLPGELHSVPTCAALHHLLNVCPLLMAAQHEAMHAPLRTRCTPLQAEAPAC